jgi:hypothetical protein
VCFQKVLPKMKPEVGSVKVSFLNKFAIAEKPTKNSQN